MILSDYLEKKLLDLMFVNTAFSPPANLYFALFSADPGESGVVGEFTIGVGAYARAVVANNTSNFPLAASTGNPTKTNATVITFPKATTAWGTATHFAIYDAASAGNMIAHGALSSVRAVAVGDTPKFGVGVFTITAANASAGGLTPFAIRKLIDHTFGAAAYTPATTIYSGLGTALSGAGVLTEWSESSYARKVTAFGAATLGAGTSANTADVQYSASVADGAATISHYGIWDDPVAGNLLCVGSVSSSRSVIIGDSADLPTGAAIITIQ